MKDACRALSQDEIDLVLTRLDGRDRLLFLLGLRSGYRISELLSLTIPDVVKRGKVVDRIRVTSKSMKGRKRSRTVPIGPKMQADLKEFIGDKTHGPLFESNKGGPISRVQAWRVLTKAFDDCGLQGKVALHSLRKSFASKVYQTSGKDLKDTQIALGHRRIDTTADYLPENVDRVSALIVGLE